MIHIWKQLIHVFLCYFYSAELQLSFPKTETPRKLLTSNFLHNLVWMNQELHNSSASIHQLIKQFSVTWSQGWRVNIVGEVLYWSTVHFGDFVLLLHFICLTAVVFIQIRISQLIFPVSSHLVLFKLLLFVQRGKIIQCFRKEQRLKTGRSDGKVMHHIFFPLLLNHPATPQIPSSLETTGLNQLTVNKVVKVSSPAAVTRETCSSKTDASVWTI